MKSTKVLLFVSNDFMNNAPILEGLHRGIALRDEENRR